MGKFTTLVPPMKPQGLHLFPILAGLTLLILFGVALSLPSGKSKKPHTTTIVSSEDNGAVAEKKAEKTELEKPPRMNGDEVPAAVKVEDLTLRVEIAELRQRLERAEASIATILEQRQPDQPQQPQQQSVPLRQEEQPQEQQEQNVVPQGNG